MQYVAIDELEHFEYHDAEIVSIELKEHCMKWMTKHINATKENTQNTFPVDMCVPEAEIVFESVEIKSITIIGFEVHNANHELIEHEETREACPGEFASILSKSVSIYCRIFGMCIEKTPADGKHKYSATFTIVSGVDVFDIQLDFDRVVISWNEFNGIAWYEEDKRKRNRADPPSSPYIQ